MVSRRSRSVAGWHAGGGTRHAPHPVGFSLVELLVVMAVIGILAAVGIPRYAALREAIAKMICTSQMRLIENAERACFLDHGAPCLFFAQLVQGAYLSHVPTCPSGGTYRWAVTDGDDPHYPDVGCTKHGGWSTAAGAGGKSGSAGTNGASEAHHSTARSPGGGGLRGADHSGGPGSGQGASEGTNGQASAGGPSATSGVGSDAAHELVEGAGSTGRVNPIRPERWEPERPAAARDVGNGRGEGETRFK